MVFVHILQIFTVFILVITILLLGIGNKINAEILGTLLGGISVYILQKSMGDNVPSTGAARPATAPGPNPPAASGGKAGTAAGGNAPAPTPAATGGGGDVPGGGAV